MGQEGVTLHLSETDTTTALSSLDGLVREVVDWAGGTHLVLVGDHMTQTLIVDNLNVSK